MPLAACLWATQSSRGSSEDRLVCGRRDRRRQARISGMETGMNIENDSGVAVDVETEQDPAERGGLTPQEIWRMESLAIGQRVLPPLERLASRIPNLRFASLCTVDGFNLCSIGLHEDQVGKMAALSSSLLSMGNAAVQSLLGADRSVQTMETITMEASGLHLVCESIARPGKASPLILFAAAQAPLGVVLFAVKSTAGDVVKLL